jgi:hypothetical protein
VPYTFTCPVTNDNLNNKKGPFRMTEEASVISKNDRSARTERRLGLLHKALAGDYFLLFTLNGRLFMSFTFTDFKEDAGFFTQLLELLE